VCCNSSCSGNSCQACTAALTGVANGICANMTPGLACLSGSGTCMAGGQCAP
jgi:hypothetical protein